MTKKKTPPSSIADLRTRIRTAGLRSTTARIAVLQRLEAATTPLSHAELAEFLVPEGYDRATVYRNLIDLTEAGLVARAELGDHVWRFELRREHGDAPSDHPHFVCVECGEVSCLNDVRFKLSPAPGAKGSLIASLTEILLKGRCEQCG
jgi:Fur family transcriptional regulator, ferric uptake regulator